MSASGASTAQARVFETGLAELKRWRDSTAGALSQFRRWGVASRLLDENSAARLEHLERRLADEKLTIAFAGEMQRGKSELINALFFGEMGARLLPGGVRCPTEIFWDALLAPMLRLLPIETRAVDRSLREFLGDPSEWREIRLDPKNPAALATACEMLAQSVQVDAEKAAAYGFAPSEDGKATISRWRYAILNIPHPLLAAGAVILDTAGHRTLASEPELTFRRVPDAAAIVFTISADTGVTKEDLDLWREHIATVSGVEHTCFVALNKIDGLREGSRPEGQVLAEIDRQVRSAAEALHTAPTRVFPLSAKQALAARIDNDRDALLRSRLYRLEQALSRGMVHQRKIDHAAAVRAEALPALAEARALVTSRLEFATQQVEELTAIQSRNQKLVESLARKASVDRNRIEQARATFGGLRAAHNRQSDELAKLLDPAKARASALRARDAVAGSAFSKGIAEALDAFFAEARENIHAAIKVIGEARMLMATVGRKFTEEYKIAAVELAPFGTERFLVELDRLEEHSSRDFKGRSSLLSGGRKTLGAQFFETVALQVVRVFEIADRETRAWMTGFIRPLEAQINSYQEQSNTRIEGMGRIQVAEMDLIAKLEDLRKLAATLASNRAQIEKHRERIAALLEIEQHSLA
jgi:hypothetical protein